MSALSPDFIAFFTELAENNRKDWFDANKVRYEASVKRPFEALVGVLCQRLFARDPRYNMQPKDCVFRIYRDVRFSHDKTPYKVHASAEFSPGGRKHNRPGYYVHFGAAEAWVGGGLYMPDKAQLSAVRATIAANPATWRAAIQDERFRNVYGEVRGERNKKLPAELAALGEPDLYLKQFYFMEERRDDDAKAFILSEDLAEQIYMRFEAGESLMRFLEDAVSTIQA